MLHRFGTGLKPVLERRGEPVFGKRKAQEQKLERKSRIRERVIEYYKTYYLQPYIRAKKRNNDNESERIMMQLHAFECGVERADPDEGWSDRFKKAYREVENQLA